MQKVDALVALVGGLVLAGAVGVAAVQDAGGGATFTVFPVLAAERVDAPLDARQPGQAFHAEAALPINQTGLHRLVVNVTLAATPAFVSGASARVVVTAPDGTTYENEADAAQGAASFVVTVEVPVAPLPAPREVAVATSADRDAALAAYQPDEGMGNWTVAVDFAPGTVPPARVDASVQADVLRWAPRIDAPAPPAK